MSLSPFSPERFFIGVDLGQAHDPTAIAVIKRIKRDREGKPPLFHVGHLERVALNTPYPAVIDRTQWLMSHQTCVGNIELAIDLTGVGRPCGDLYRQRGVPFAGVVITGGHSESHPEPDVHHVPKLTLISHLQALLHEGRLLIQKNLTEAETLVRELQDFRVQYSDSGHMQYSARNGKHDDLVLALAISVWLAMRPASSADGWCEYLRRQAESSADLDDVRASGPDFNWSFSEPPKWIKLQVPAGIEDSFIEIGDARHIFRHAENRAYVELPPDHARILLRRESWRSENLDAHDALDNT